MRILTALLKILMSGVTVICYEKPIDEAVVIGSKVTFGCRFKSSSDILWKFKPVHQDHLLVFTSYNYSKSEKNYTLITSSSGHHHLVIEEAKFQHAGTYSCFEYEENLSKTIGHAAELIVFGAEHKCQMTLIEGNPLQKEDGYVSMSCGVEYRGNLVPRMLWINLTSGLSVSAQLETILNKQVKSTLIIQVTNKHSEDIFRCITYFNQSTPENVHLGVPAKNVPNYTYTWTSRPFWTLYNETQVSVKFNSTICSSSTLAPTAGYNGNDSPTVALIVICVAAGSLLLVAIIIYTFQRGSNTKNKIGTRNQYTEQWNLSTSGETSIQRATESSQDNDESPNDVITPYATNTTLMNARSDVSTLDHSDIRFNNSEEHNHVGMLNSNQNVGADGIIYAQLNATRGCDVIPSMQHRQTKKPLFSTSIYASVDHTAQAIPSPSLELHPIASLKSHK